MKKLQEDIKNKLASSPKTDEDKLKIMGLKTTSNIQTLIRDLYHPSYKSKIDLSWIIPKSLTSDEAKVSDNSDTLKKRHAPIVFGNSGEEKKPKYIKKSNVHQQMYSVPSGKYSSKLGKRNFESRFKNTNYSKGENKGGNFNKRFSGRY